MRSVGGFLMRTDRLIRDPVYDYISLPQVFADVVDNAIYQRLRRVAQTSLTSLVYPSATGSRFEHGLGAMHLANRAWTSAWSNASPETRDAFMVAAHTEIPQIPAGVVQCGDHVGVAISGVALLHDVGHPPFSHVLEHEYQRMLPSQLQHSPELLEEWKTFGSPMHEFAGVILTRRLLENVTDNLRVVLRRVYEADPDDGTWAGAAHSVVAGEVDVDRLDYLIARCPEGRD